jgi:hypothetical protein
MELRKFRPSFTERQEKRLNGMVQEVAPQLKISIFETEDFMERLRFDKYVP